MPKFFNKNELIILMLIILMFDVKGFCDVSLEHIINKNDRKFTLFFLTMITMIFSMYVYDVVCNITPPPNVKYSVTQNSNHTCEENVKYKSNQYNDIINEMEENCKYKSNYGIYASEKISLTIISILLLIFAYYAIYNAGVGPTTNNKVTRMWLSSPIFILVCCILSFAHIYMPLTRK
jgi:hypothetical protein